MDSLFSDVRQAVRRLAAVPAFTAVAVLTLAVGVGASTAIYSAVDAILLRPLPFNQPDLLLEAWRIEGNRQSRYLSPDSVRTWRLQKDVFAAAEPFRNRSVALLGSGEPLFVLAAEVGGGLMATLGVPARIGRVIQPADAQSGHNVVVLSHGLWRSRFASDPEIVGQSVRVDDRVFDVVGVMPPAFRFPRDQTALWIPLSAPASASPVPVHALVRLQPGLTPDLAEARLEAAAPARTGGTSAGSGGRVELRPLGGDRVNRSERYALYVLFAAVACVLLISCANVANLLLVQAAGRERETAVRAAIGASRLRLARQVVTETVVLAAAAGALGIMLAVWAIDLLAAYTPRHFTFLALNEISLDTRVLTFAALLTLLAAAFAGLVPAIRGSRTRLQETLKSGAPPATASARQEQLRHTFAVVQLALTLMLLTGAGLLGRTFLTLTDIHPGFDPQNLVTMDLSLPRWKYSSRAAQQQFFDQLANRLRMLSGVTAVTVAGGKPPTAGGISFGLRFEIDGIGVVLDDPNLVLPTAEVDPDYLTVLGIPPLGGRTFSAEDRPGGVPVIIISQEMARRLWKGASPIGQRLRFDPGGTWHTVVGVVGDVYQFEYHSPGGTLAAYYPRAQSPGMTAQETVILRTVGDPVPLMPAIRQTVWSIDPDQPILTLTTMEASYREFLAVPRFQALLMGAFALMALAIAAVGLYGVLSCAIVQRTREFGIRMALGARPMDVLSLVLRRALAIVGVGLLLGAAGALVLGRAISSLLVDVPPHDPFTYLLVILTLAATSLAACWLPARRATRVDPIVALRCD